MLIVEGSDNLGKTVACRRLVELANARKVFPVTYGHMSRPPDWFNFCDHYEFLAGKGFVQDRFHLGALVWHEGVMDQSQLRKVEKYLAEMKAIVVVFYSEDDDMYRRRLEAQAKEELFGDAVILRGNRVFRDMVYARHPMLPVIDFDHEFEKGFPNDRVLNSWIDAWIGNFQG